MPNEFNEQVCPMEPNPGATRLTQPIVHPRTPGSIIHDVMLACERVRDTIGGGGGVAFTQMSRPLWFHFILTGASCLRHWITTHTNLHTAGGNLPRVNIEHECGQIVTNACRGSQLCACISRIG